jgi:hypothetical protein
VTDRLETLLRADQPPARDALFRIAVLARLERRRFRRQIAATAAVGAATVIIGVNAGAISAWFAGDITRIVGVLAAVAVVARTFPSVSHLVPSSLRHLARTGFARVTQIVSESFVD